MRRVVVRTPRRTATGSIGVNTASEMLLIDFEQAFVVHNNYKDAERELFKLSLRVLAFPGLIAGAIVSAQLISSPDQLQTILALPIIWASLIVAAVLNLIIVRAYVVTDKVQTEAKHQVNRLRALYLHALAEHFPTGWKPVWGSTNSYLENRVKFKAAAFTPIVLGMIDAAYLAYGLTQLTQIYAPGPHRWQAALGKGTSFFLLHLEVTWNALRVIRRIFHRW